MKLFVVYFLAVAVNCALSLPAAEDVLPCMKPNNPSLIDIIIKVNIPLMQQTVTVNGNRTNQMINNEVMGSNQGIKNTTASINSTSLIEEIKNTTASIISPINKLNTTTVSNNTTVSNATTVSNTTTLPLCVIPAPVPPPRPKVPKDYVISSETKELITAVKYHKDGKPWNDARKTCLKEGGFLAFASNKKEEDLFMKMMGENKINNLWVGIHDFFAKHDFSTVLGDVANSTAYYTWYPGEPNSKGAQTCTQYWKSSGIIGLDDTFCNSNYTFICKMQLRK